MAMKKTGENVPAEVFTGEQAVVLNQHLQKRGKALSDFTDNQREELEADLAKVREQDLADEESGKENAEAS